MEEYLIYVTATWVIKKGADFFVKKSKLTANKTDDIIANGVKEFVSFLTGAVKKKKKL